ncbi:MAG TPA: iron-containing redox enzyme family protein [Thermoanaerobaculia bacterium]|nr:iron-containing redox enzyme family protein [Thermoanaerobaculia bacterium]
MASGASGALSHSQRLRGKIRLAAPRLDAVARTFWTHPRLPELFPEFLFLLHSMIRTSVPMMREAAEAARRQGPDDPTALPLADYYERHAREELHHDDWLLDDMVALGMDREQVLSRLPSPLVASLVGAHYYWMRHVHPVALLGYLAVLEGNPPTVERLTEIRQRAGLPEAGFRTLIKHAHLDPHHRDELDEQIDRLPLDGRLVALLGVAALDTVERVSLAFEEILDRFAR